MGTAAVVPPTPTPTPTQSPQEEAKPIKEAVSYGVLRGENGSGDGQQAEESTSMVRQKNESARRSLSHRFMKSMRLGGLYCHDCAPEIKSGINEDNSIDVDYTTPSELYNLSALKESVSNVSPLVAGPMLLQNEVALPTIEGIIEDYIHACNLYGRSNHINAGIMTTIRFSLPSLRVSSPFHDADMLALVELLLKHGNRALNFIHRLDFTVAGARGRGIDKKIGFTSHGALALSKFLQISKNVREVFLSKHRIGPYGSSAIFMACSQNTSIHTLLMRGCRTRARGAMAFVDLICKSTKPQGLRVVDLSANQMGHAGTSAIDDALEQREKRGMSPISADLDANLVFPEVMNGCTHGLGVLLSLVGAFALSNFVKGKSYTHEISCAIYSTSLIALYLSSTLYHSMFALQETRYILELFDLCAIYILISGSYTPFLQIVLSDQPKWSIGLLSIIWLCCIMGISVQVLYPDWKYRSRFSLAMYLSMGWCVVLCLPELVHRLPTNAIRLMVLGGVGYTAGVPFFLRNNNLDHAIWHLFVLSGSIFHWIGIYIYVAPRDLISVP